MTFARKAFVLMPFDPSFDDTYQLGIREACKNEGWECSRVDEQIFSGLILERIYDEIKSSDLIIADMSGRNPNVFYEVGYAHALHKRVIMLTSSAGDIPFDLKGHRHIIYDGGIAKLKKSLEQELSFILAENPWKDFKLDNLTFYSLKSSSNRSIVVENFISLEGGPEVPLSSTSPLQVPGEISNYGKGIYFDFAVGIRNNSRFLLDLSDITYRIKFPPGVVLADDSLKLSHGKLVEPQNDESLVISAPFTGTVLEPGASHTLMFHLRTTAHDDKVYLTVLPLQVMMSRAAEWFSAETTLELAPLRRMN